MSTYNAEFFKDKYGYVKAIFDLVGSEIFGAIQQPKNVKLHKTVYDRIGKIVGNYEKKFEEMKSLPTISDDEKGSLNNYLEAVKLDFKNFGDAPKAYEDMYQSIKTLADFITTILSKPETNTSLALNRALDAQAPNLYDDSGASSSQIFDEAVNEAEEPTQEQQRFNTEVEVQTPSVEQIIDREIDLYSKLSKKQQDEIRKELQEMRVGMISKSIVSENIKPSFLKNANQGQAGALRQLNDATNLYKMPSSLIKEGYSRLGKDTYIKSELSNGRFVKDVKFKNDITPIKILYNTSIGRYMAVQGNKQPYIALSLEDANKWAIGGGWENDDLSKIRKIRDNAEKMFMNPRLKLNARVRK